MGARFVTGDWTVVPSRNLLVRGGEGEEIRLEPRVMDVLVVLVERAGEVIPKEVLIERVWPDRHVTDDVLTVTIYALRKALGDEARRPRYIETVSRRGYRWIASVGDRQAPVVPVVPAPRALRRTTGIAAAAIVLIAASALWMATSPRRTRHVAPPEAHEAYLKGRYFLDQRSNQGWKQAREQFERAIQLDPANPAAHAGLADTYSAMSDFGAAPAIDMRPRALKEAQQALALDARSAEGHAAMGRVQFLFDWNFAAAERSLARAVALDPDYMPAYQSVAWLESARGRYAAAIRAARRAVQLDPVNTARYTELAWVLGLNGRHADALAEIERALQLNPQAFAVHFMKGWTLEMAGQPDAAFACYRTALRFAGAPDDSLQRIDAAYRAEGLPGYYRRWLEPRSPLPMSNTGRAQLYVRVGQLDRALDSLERAYEQREGALAWVNVEPSFNPLRADVRFRQIAAHIRP